MLKTLEKYQKCSCSALEANPPADDTQSSYQEYLRLKAKVDVLQQSQRNLLGDDLDPLSVKDLDQLEHQLEFSLKEIRSIRTQSMFDQLSELQRKEQLMNEANKNLKRKLDESTTQSLLQRGWELGGLHFPTNGQIPRLERFFQPLECDSKLQIRYSPAGGQDHTNAVPQSQNVNGFIPGWML
ncbi:hypothetical protein IFM89_004638 [Coptis chinensis]|uniref:K-box domain-containing protein n=1 Tax=Coptis chinensis TaxID=261450 RepID=A0A835H229_9MAGN|nr:hypothetical protein IFM89_004638 [Coptis chinensis]